MAKRSGGVSFKIEQVFKLLGWIAWILLMTYCMLKVSDCYAKYALKRISTSSYVVHENPFKYPAFTACVSMDREITEAVGNMSWWSDEKYRNVMKFPFENLRTVNDGFCW